MNLETDIQYLKGVGPHFAKKLNKLDIFKLIDLIYYFPRAYEDRRKIQTISQVPEYVDKRIMVKGKVMQTKVDRPRPRYYVVKTVLRDHTGAMAEIVWFNQKFMKDVLKEGKEVFVSGKVVFDKYNKRNVIYAEDYEVIRSADEDFLNCVMPVYTLTEGVHQKKIRALVKDVLDKYLDQVHDPFLDNIKESYKLIALIAAVKQMHFPEARETWKLAHDRLVFDEFFYMQLGLAIRYYSVRESVQGISFDVEGDLVENYKKEVPYQFTGAQARVVEEVFSDMNVSKPMNRLVQGDVGSGKTDVAIMASLAAVQSGYQTAIMAPTLILATQHVQKISERLEKLGVNIVSLLGKHTKKEKEKIYQQIKEHEVDVVIGTNAIIQEGVEFAKLGLAIIDEQHRFGVVQRQALKEKGNNISGKPGLSDKKTGIDLLVMTATPIPRTLALTCFGDLDKSIIDEMPPGRIPIKTSLVMRSESKRMYEFCRNEIKKGRQVYIIYPLVEETEKMDLKAATESFKILKEKVFSEYQVDLLHGRMKNKEKEAVMQDFRDNKTQILVSTTVIEVGVDVPNATIMVVEHAGRFGLAQLHQLRGRVGRGGDQAYCFLVENPKSQDAKVRMKAMIDTTDGFKLAEVDLQLRGPGDQLGTRQSGLPELELADLVKDENILKQARKAAYDLVEKDKQLSHQENYLIKKELRKRNRGFVDYVLLD